MTAAPQSSRHTVWTRVALTVVALPFATVLLAAAVGAGNLPLGGIVALPLAYLLGVLAIDLKDAWFGSYRVRPQFLLWWWLAVLPTCAWLVWLELRT